MTTKLIPGTQLPTIQVPLLNGGQVTLGVPNKESTWRAIFIYRGKHCGVCTHYLGALNERLDEFKEMNVDVLAVSADPAEKVTRQMDIVKPGFNIGHSLSIQQMEALGLYISNPRSDQETDLPFSEPGLFVVNKEGIIQIVDIANYPFMRPDLDWLIKGIRFALNPDNNYPIRGTRI